MNNKNIITNIICFALNGAIGIFYTPYLLKKIGMEEYGLNSLITNLFIWTNWLGLILNWSASRYLTIALAEKNYKKISEIYTTSLYTSIAVLTISFLATIYISLNISELIKINNESENSAKNLVFIIGLTSGLTVISNITELLFYCQNRLDIKAISQLAKTLFATLLTILLFEINGPRIEWIGLSTLIITSLSLIATHKIGSKTIPDLSINIKNYKIKTLVKFIKSNIYTTIDQLGIILISNANIIIINKYYGPKISAEYTLALQWDTILKSIMNAVSIFTPTYILLITNKDFNSLRTTSLNAAKITAVTVSIFGGTLIGLSEELIYVWIKIKSQIIINFTLALTTITIVNSFANPLYGLWQAKNKLLWPCITTLITGLISVALSMWLVHNTNLKELSPIIGSGIAFTIRNYLFAIPYISNITKEHSWSYYTISLLNIIGCGIIIITSKEVAKILSPNNWIEILYTGFFSTIIASPYIWYILLTNENKLAIKRMLNIRSTQ